jgi:capsular polysaccharide biosynthesis protein
VPETPIAPNRKLIAALGLVGGIVIGVALVGLREFLDRTLRTVQDAETALQLPVLAVLSVVDAPTTRRRFWQRARA